MSASKNNDSPSNTCARTNAVLAVHLDGDLGNDKRDSMFQDQIEPEQFGYGFVSHDSLHDHLRDCSSCQQSLQRARRLDAVLASTAGRCVVEHSVAYGGFDELADRLLGRAMAAAASNPSAGETPGEPTSLRLVEATGQSSELQSGAVQPGAVQSGAVEGTRTGTWIAAGSVAAACLATWLSFASVDGAKSDNGAASSQPSEHIAQVAAPEQPGSQADSAAGPVTASLPASLARRMHAARNRELPNQRTASPNELAARMADRQLSVPDRLAAARRLIQATRTGSMDARHATDELLAALASCGDNDNHELTVHEQLLDMLRSNSSLLVRIEHRLLATLEMHDFDAASIETFGAIVVAARVDNKRLDSVLRRTLRRHEEVGDAIASGLRCGVRLHGAGKLLLNCWHDQVASGSQENTPKWAAFWFRGQSLASFAELAQLRLATRSHADRVRCCLAMGCVNDDSTLPALLAALKSPRRDESCAAAWGIASLPHRVLKQLLPKAKVQSASILRAALARAGMRQANPWLEQLALSKPQLRLLRSGPLRRFPEVIAWFRNGPPVAD